MLFLKRMHSGRFVGMLLNVEEVWMKNSHSMTSLDVSGIRILQMI